MKIIAAIIVLVVLLITRELWTWFLKQNQIVKQNIEIIRLLRKIAREPEEETPVNSLKKIFKNNSQYKGI